jgi:hypothetical protein
MGFKSHHIFYLTLNAIRKNNLLILPSFQHQALKGTFQEFKQQNFGGLLGPNIDLDAVTVISLQEADFSLKISEVEES